MSPDPILPPPPLTTHTHTPRCEGLGAGRGRAQVTDVCRLSNRHYLRDPTPVPRQNETFMSLIDDRPAHVTACSALPCSATSTCIYTSTPSLPASITNSTSPYPLIPLPALNIISTCLNPLPLTTSFSGSHRHFFLPQRPSLPSSIPALTPPPNYLYLPQCTHLPAPSNTVSFCVHA